MTIFKCKMCGGSIEVKEGASVGICDSCGTQQTLPRLDDERRANLYNRANHFRRNNEFDKAAGIYEKILNEDRSDAEAYWSLVLCRYGVEYVEDPATHKRVPTVNRTQFTSIFNDDDYKSALRYADGYQRSIYEKEANAINEIQKGILAVSRKEEPFDVFICYKETDHAGRRTPDSVLANDLYHHLTHEGFKVFFSRITLEDKLGTAYEPYIFAALNSAKVMVVLGTKPEYINAAWVKNEWNRYLALVKQSGGKKVLIPAYKDMDPYDLPEEFSHLQAQDMSKLGFMQDLIRGIKKITRTDEPKPIGVGTAAANAMGAGVKPLLKRVFIFLEDGNWEDADRYCERVLDQEPENAWAYFGKLMAELRIHRKGDLTAFQESFRDNKNYQKAVRYGGDKMKDLVRLNERNEKRIVKIKNEKYEKALALRSVGEYKEACELLKDLNFKDSVEQLAQNKKYCGSEIQVGSHIFFGSYGQGNANGDTKIEWLVLDRKNNNEILVISRYTLDCKPFDSVGDKGFFKIFDSVRWESCSIRKWLNNEFLNTAFNSKEQEMIVKRIVSASKNPRFDRFPGRSTSDKVFILSISEVNQYFSSDEERKCEPTIFAISQGVHVENGTCMWWLRTGGKNMYDVSYVKEDGSVAFYGREDISEYIGVRPALWVNLNLSNMRKTL